MKLIVMTPFWSVLLAAGLLAGTAPAASASTAASGAADSAQTKKKAQGGGQVRFLPGSAETVKDRSNRLRRECKGQVNAGACAGYTR